MASYSFISPSSRCATLQHHRESSRFLVLARSTKQTKKGNDKQPKKKQGFLSQFTDAIDFAQTRSEDDRNLIDNAKLSLGKRAKPGEDRQKMSKEQYQALRRKVGGTARDYWKDFVEADEVKGYKSNSESNVPGLPFLIAIVVGLIVATVVVSSQTAGGPPPQSSPDSQASPAAAVQE